MQARLSTYGLVFAINRYNIRGPLIRADIKSPVERQTQIGYQAGAKAQTAQLKRRTAQAHRPNIPAPP